MKTKMFVAGNCVVDLIFKGDVFQEREKKHRLMLATGGKYVVEEFWQFYGGGGANASLSLAKQNLGVTLLSRLGNDVFGRECAINLEKNCINTDLISFDAKSTPISAIILPPGGERTIITYRSDADYLIPSQRIMAKIKQSDWFVLFSLALCPKTTKLAFLKDAKKAGLKTFISLHGTEYFKGMEYLSDYFKYTDILHLNAHEMADIFKTHTEKIDFYKENFSQKLNIPLVLVSFDVFGNFAYSKEGIHHQPIYKVKVVDTTGAGDAFASGFLGKYVKTANIPESLDFGTKNAAAKIEHLGAQTGLLKDV